MAFQNTEEQRKEIYTYVRQFEEKLETLIADVQSYLTRIQYPLADIPAIDLLERLLWEPPDKRKRAYYQRAHRGKMRGLYRYFVHAGNIKDDQPENVFGKDRDHIFLALREFWDVKDANIATCQDLIEGTYQFFACSEDQAGHVVIGALRIKYDPKTGAVCVEELQKQTPDNQAGERWTGYGLMRRNRVVLTMSASRFQTPKFYMLVPYYTEPIVDGADTSTRKGEQVPIKAAYLVGGMVKLGKDAGVFLSGIYMQPDENAFKKVRVVPESALLPKLSPQIRSSIHRWAQI